MPLKPGTRLGSYEVAAAIGRGGMGEVFRAHDTKLQRVVALKVLPDLFVSDPELGPGAEPEMVVGIEEIETIARVTGT
jgi:serine/threonine protein kinase